MAKRLPAEDLNFLARVDERWRKGETLETIAVSEGLSNASSLRWKLYGLGFRTTRRGGLCVEATLEQVPFRVLVERGELVAAEELVAV